MKAKLKILRKTTSTIETKRGPAQKHSFQLEGKNGPFWASCFASQMTAEWQEGSTQEMDLVQNGQYWNIVTPKPQDEMLVMLKRIEEKIDRLIKTDVASIPPDIDDDPQHEEPPDDNIPF
jgi:hypothetical protein